MHDGFHARTLRLPELFRQLDASKMFAMTPVELPESPAIYAFFETKDPAYVGRTRNLKRRIRGHLSKSHFSSPFVFAVTRRALYPTKMGTKKLSRDILMKDNEFNAIFDINMSKLKGMGLKFLVIEDHIDQYLFELYATMCYGLRTDGFDTH